ATRLARTCVFRDESVTLSGWCLAPSRRPGSHGRSAISLLIAPSGVSGPVPDTGPWLAWTRLLGRRGGGAASSRAAARLLSEAVRELRDDPAAEHVRHLQDLLVDRVVGGDVGRPVAL